ncbi:MAG: CapA family protein [Kofleriaceae bacterium]|nr:CapA family protein [Kofleriaceae bacterium]
MGDIMFGGTFNGRFVPQAVPEHDPLADVEALFASDLPLANLETTVVDDIPKELPGNLRFAATPDQVALLPAHGLTAVTIANNHANDLDRPGVDETPGHLAELGLHVIGAARPEEPRVRVDTIEVRGWKLGFVAATAKLNRGQKKADPPIPFVDPDDLGDTLVPVIEAAKADHDLVIVVLHWGTQYDDAPSRWQITAAHRFIDAGAAAVIGHHPHVLQGIERYHDGVIAYSLGNFVFQNAMPRVRDTGVLRLAFEREARCLDRAVFHPAIERRSPIHHPEPAKGRDGDEVATRLITLSKAKPLGTTWTREGDDVVVAGSCP